MSTQKYTQIKNLEELGNTIIVSKDTSSRHRNWFFTLNNYTRKDINTIFDEREKENCNKYCFQEEKGKSGTPHLQGVISYVNAVSFNRMKNLLPRANWKVAKNLKKALAYCCKEDTRNGKTWANGYMIPKKLTAEAIEAHWLREHKMSIDVMKTIPL